MKEYLKMADVFEGEVKAVHLDGDAIDELVHGDGSGTNWTIEDSAYWLATNYEHAGYAAHAINSHDELVAEVERLRKAIELASMTLDEVDRVLTERIKNGAYDLDDISAEVEGAIKRLSETE